MLRRANLLCLPCVTANLRDYASAVGVRVTATHLVYARERIATCWRLACCDQGMRREARPLEKITDVILKEPAGGCPPQTLHTLEVQTASNAGAVGAELVLVGLREADARALREAPERKPLRRQAARRARDAPRVTGGGGRAGGEGGRGRGVPNGPRWRRSASARRRRRRRRPSIPLRGVVCRARRRSHLRARGIFGDEVAGALPRAAAAADPADGARRAFVVQQAGDVAPPTTASATLRGSTLCSLLEVPMGDLVRDLIVGETRADIAYALAADGAAAAGGRLVWWADGGDGPIYAVDVSDWYVAPSIRLRALPAVRALDRLERLGVAMGALCGAIDDAREQLNDAQYLALCDCAWRRPGRGRRGRGRSPPSAPPPRLASSSSSPLQPSPPSAAAAAAPPAPPPPPPPPAAAPRRRRRRRGAARAGAAAPPPPTARARRTRAGSHGSAA